MDRSIGPFSELPGQVSALGVFDLPSEDVSENLIAKEQHNQHFSANGLVIPQPLHNTGMVISPCSTELKPTTGALQRLQSEINTVNFLSV